MFIPRFETSNKGIKQRKRSKLEVERAATTAQWIRLRLSSCDPGFESQAQQLRFFSLNWNCDVKRTKMNQKRPGLAQFQKVSDPIMTFLTIKSSVTPPSLFTLGSIAI